MSVTLVCDQCGKDYKKIRSHQRFCCFPCSQEYRTIPIRERFFRFVVVGADPDDCWGWTGFATKSNTGYGKLGLRGASVLAHRLSYEIHVGPIPKGLWVLHRCDNPRCTNPRHLFLGTQADNFQDMMNKGRNARGAKSGGAKLTESNVVAIRDLIAQGHTQRSVAARFGCSRSLIQLVVARKSWKHVP